MEAMNNTPTPTPHLTPKRQNDLARHAYVGQWAALIAAVGSVIGLLTGAYTAKVNANRDVEIARLKSGQAQLSQAVAATAQAVAAPTEGKQAAAAENAQQHADAAEAESKK